MKVGKEFKYWGNGNSTSHGYYAEVDVDEFPTLAEMAKESIDKNEKVYQFLSYVAIKRAYQQALKEGVISGEQYEGLIEPFHAERKFEDQIKSVEREKLRG